MTKKIKKTKEEKENEYWERVYKGLYPNGSEQAMKRFIDNFIQVGEYQKFLGHFKTGKPNLEHSWAMPNPFTFKIQIVQEIIKDYSKYSKGLSLDPFAGKYSPADITNDLDPDSPAQFHMDALEFLQDYRERSDITLVFLDPPYSPRQFSECYKKAGKKGFNGQNASYLKKVKDIVAEMLPIGGIVISCGWNTTGLGLNRGFTKLLIHIISHGGSHNDTIIVVEMKTKDLSEEDLRILAQQLSG